MPISYILKINSIILDFVSWKAKNPRYTAERSQIHDIRLVDPLETRTLL